MCKIKHDNVTKAALEFLEKFEDDDAIRIFAFVIIKNGIVIIDELDHKFIGAKEAKEIIANTNINSNIGIEVQSFCTLYDVDFVSDSFEHNNYWCGLPRYRLKQVEGKYIIVNEEGKLVGHIVPEKILKLYNPKYQ